jgi:predicted amino acid dehydrogenase
MAAKEASEMVASAVDLGRDLGAEIVGLGALTSVVTRGGHNVLGRDVAITSGNSFTTLMAIEALMLGARKMHIHVSEARAAVVGATGSIGRACALLLAQKVKDIILFGNARHAVSSRNRLNSLVQDIFRQAQDGLSQGKCTGIGEWVGDVIKMLERQDTPAARDYLEIIERKTLDLQLVHEISAFLEIDAPIRISLDLDQDLPLCNLVVAASNSPEYILFPGHFQTGSVVCDVARPADVSPEVALQRDDVLILEGGLVQYPDQVNFGPNFGYRDGVGLGCLSETILLAMEGEGKSYSIGTKLPLEDIEHLRNLGQEHGFSLAGLRNQNRELTDQEIEEIYQNSLNLTHAQNE